MGCCLTEVRGKPGKQHRRPRFSSTHNVKHPRTMGQEPKGPHPAIRRIRHPALKPAPFAKRRGYKPRPFPGQPPFFAKSTGFPPAIFGRKRLTFGPIGWIRKAIAAVGRKGPYTPRTLSLQQHFSRKCVKKEFSAACFHRPRERVRKTLKGLCFRAADWFRQGWM
jgi:hypothetical protein